jgi:hypothetical protein
MWLSPPFGPKQVQRAHKRTAASPEHAMYIGEVSPHARTHTQMYTQMHACLHA